MKNCLLSLLVIVLVASAVKLTAQSDRDLIEATLMDYIEGTANGEPERLQRAFHQEANLYFVKENKLEAWTGSSYIANVQPGRKSDRIGKIIDVTIANDAASATIEVDMPGRKRLYTDFMLLLKLEGHWKIIHKSFSFKTY